MWLASTEESSKVRTYLWSIVLTQFLQLVDDFPNDWPHAAAWLADYQSSTFDVHELILTLKHGHPSWREVRDIDRLLNFSWIKPEDMVQLSNALTHSSQLDRAFRRYLFLKKHGRNPHLTSQWQKLLGFGAMSDSRRFTQVFEQHLPSAGFPWTRERITGSLCPEMLEHKSKNDERAPKTDIED